MVILEEASRLDRAVFTEVVVPLLGVKDTAVLAISTPLDENNFYSQMLELTQSDGVTPLFNVISVSLICDECKQKDLKNQLTCPHRQNEIPPWKTEQRQSLVKKLLENDPEMCVECFKYDHGTNAVQTTMCAGTSANNWER